MIEFSKEKLKALNFDVNDFSKGFSKDYYKFKLVVKRSGLSLYTIYLYSFDDVVCLGSWSPYRLGLFIGFCELNFVKR